MFRITRQIILFVISKGDVRELFHIRWKRQTITRSYRKKWSLAGDVFDKELHWLPESAVNRATGRCSVDSSNSVQAVIRMARITGSSKTGLTRKKEKPDLSAFHDG